MRVLLCGGGTAGHIMPAIAMAEIIEKNFPKAVIAFAGRKGGEENSAYINTHHHLYTIDIQGIRRKFDISNLKAILKLLKSGRDARAIINDFNPNLIIGTGGYVCYPFINQGQHMKISTIIHESNIMPGLVTRTLGKKCNILFLNSDISKNYLRKSSNTRVIGTPTRKSFNTLTKIESKKQLNLNPAKKLIVSFGGSLGAKLLNDIVIEFIGNNVIDNEDVFHIHATGTSYYDEYLPAIQKMTKNHRNVRILPYIENMPLLLSAADLAITRSGAITTSELSRSGTPSILIPSPNVTGNHQYLNAEYMQKLGASILLEEKELTADRLKKEIFEIFNNTDSLKRMSKNARKAQPTNTDSLIVEAINELRVDKHQ